MSDMISVASGFQYSVNIGYDLNNDDKLRNFIPTKSAISLLEDILLSTHDSSNNRARVLIGAYGKGKSHIVLMILSMLMGKDLALFEKVMPKIKENPALYQTVLNYYDSNKKILPVIITGSNTSLPQAFLLALQRTLKENDLIDVMPESNYKAAVAVINRWKKDFPSTYDALQKAIDIPIQNFINELEEYNITIYEQFEKIYSQLTSGSIFNPFLGFDVVELYEEAIKGLKKKGYSGIYVVYDEFSKFLEANIVEASVSDTKMLQDFAEKCNRSGDEQLHLLLISHKEISNYIDKLPKQKVDGWRGVSERFSHIHLNNNFSQTYDIIASVIEKDQEKWNNFCQEFSGMFQSVKEVYSNHSMFSEADDHEKYMVFYGCYPLHPVSTFILPRLSERVAQNERTLFTFLSADGISTLPYFLKQYNDDKFKLITSDEIFDYFEPLMKKEVYSGDIHDNYILANIILNQLEEGSLASKIVKTIALIYILGQFDKIKPTVEELTQIYSIDYDRDEIAETVKDLIEKQYVIYLKRSNLFLRLKESSGIDVKEKIQDLIAATENKISVKEILNNCNYDNYIYPSRYNDSYEITRYFSFEFINSDEVENDTDWKVKSEHIDADGVIYGIIPNETDSISDICNKLLESSKDFKQYIFVVPKKYAKIHDIVREFYAVSLLREEASQMGDSALFDEYDIIYEDLRDVISEFINSYTRPEKLKAIYISNGSKEEILRKAALTELMSKICDEIFCLTPVINNEAINKNEITSMAYNSRTKLIAAMLRNELEENLGLIGTGQEVSIMRSTLIRTGILMNVDSLPKICLKPENDLMANVLDVIQQFILGAKNNCAVSFSELYEHLTAPEYHIGLRKGVIPIYLAAVLHEYRKEAVIMDRNMQIPLTADSILQINANPGGYYVKYLDWDENKDEFIKKLADVFNRYIITAEEYNSYDYIVSAMKRWYMSLPKYTKEVKKTVDGARIDRRYSAFRNYLKNNLSANELLFERLPAEFGYTEELNAGLAENIAAAKAFYDGVMQSLKGTLISAVKKIFVLQKNKDKVQHMSLTSVIKDWCEQLDPLIYENIFADGTEKCLALFRTVTNDEETFIVRLAKAATELRIEDWDDSTYSVFLERIKQYKATAEAYTSESIAVENAETSGYQISYVDEKGQSVTKRFERVETTKRGKLLFNAITDELDSMGYSISEQEKRQILMEILKSLC